MPNQARLVLELLVVNGRVMQVVHCPCGDGVVLHAGDKAAAACHCGKHLDDAASVTGS